MLAVAQVIPAAHTITLRRASTKKELHFPFPPSSNPLLIAVRSNQDSFSCLQQKCPGARFTLAEINQHTNLAENYSSS